MPAAKLLGKTEADILSPVADKLLINGETFLILPLPDSALMQVGDSLASITEVLDGFAKAGKVDTTQVIAVIPTLLRFLLPNASVLIAAAIGKDAEWVSINVPLSKKLEALRYIIDHENVPEILKNWQALVGMFTQPAPTTPTTD